MPAPRKEINIERVKKRLGYGYLTLKDIALLEKVSSSTLKRRLKEKGIACYHVFEAKKIIPFFQESQKIIGYEMEASLRENIRKIIQEEFIKFFDIIIRLIDGDDSEDNGENELAKIT